MDSQSSIEDLWKPVPGYEDRYEVSNQGRIRSFFQNNIKVQQPHQCGYLMTCLYRDGKTEAFLVHRLVLSAFVGECPDGMVACHFNDVKTDNRLANLRWDTREANAEDAIRNGRILVGTAVNTAILTPTLVQEMRAIRNEEKLTYETLGQRFGVDKKTAWRACHGESWKHDVGEEDVSKSWRDEFFADLLRAGQARGIDKFDRELLWKLVENTFEDSDAFKGKRKTLKKHYRRATKMTELGRKKLLNALEKVWPGHATQKKRTNETRRKKHPGTNGEAPVPPPPPESVVVPPPLSQPQPPSSPPLLPPPPPFPGLVSHPTWRGVYCSAMAGGCGKQTKDCTCYGAATPPPPPPVLTEAGLEELISDSYDEGIATGDIYIDPPAPPVPPPPPPNAVVVPPPPSPSPPPGVDLVGDATIIMHGKHVAGPAPTVPPFPPPTVCIACSDTGRNSNGGPCHPCVHAGRVRASLEAPAPPVPPAQTYGHTNHDLSQVPKGKRTSRVCFSITLNQDATNKTVVVEVLNSYLVEQTEFGATVKDSAWLGPKVVDLLVEYTVHITEAYQTLLEHELVGDAEAKPAADMGAVHA